MRYTTVEAQRIDLRAGRPRWRGGLHAIAAVVMPLAGLVLIWQADGVQRLAVGIYVVAATAMFGTSALYHRGAWSPRTITRLKRADHTMIFVGIAGNYTVFFALAVTRPAAAWLSLGVWTVAAMGAMVKLANLERPGGAADIWYVAVGWFGLLALPWLTAAVTAREVGLVLAGGVLYTVGAIVLGARRPDPSPRLFGYHEVGHAAMLGGQALHFVVYMILV